MKIWVVILALCVSITTSEDGYPNFGTKEERDSCPFWQNIGCLMDGHEKACEKEEGHEDVPETNPLFNPIATESMYMCCCPKPYLPCKISERNRKCDTALAIALQSTSKDASLVIQMARKEMIKMDKRCEQHLMPVEPMTGCEKERRKDLWCETVTWQWEELGDGDEHEFNSISCKIPNIELVDNPKRKGNRLSEHPNKEYYLELLKESKEGQPEVELKSKARLKSRSSSRTSANSMNLKQNTSTSWFDINFWTGILVGLCILSVMMLYTYCRSASSQQYRKLGHKDKAN